MSLPILAKRKWNTDLAFLWQIERLTVTKSAATRHRENRAAIKIRPTGIVYVLIHHKYKWQLMPHTNLHNEMSPQVPTLHSCIALIDQNTTTHIPDTTKYMVLHVFLFVVVFHSCADTDAFMEINLIQSSYQNTIQIIYLIIWMHEQEVFV